MTNSKKKNFIYTKNESPAPTVLPIYFVDAR